MANAHARRIVRKASPWAKASYAFRRRKVRDIEASTGAGDGGQAG
jgi:hypothetical protein